MENIENVQQAVSVLIQAAQVAQSKGVFTLSESRIIADAIDFLIPPVPGDKNAEEQKT